MKTILLFACLFISGCSTDALKEYIDCAWDSNHEQYIACLGDKE